MIDLAHSAGRYGAYIWPAYAVSAIGLVAMAVDTALRARRWRRDADRRAKDSPAMAPDEP
jgi:heme exporter protein D